MEKSKDCDPIKLKCLNVFLTFNIKIFLLKIFNIIIFFCINIIFIQTYGIKGFKFMLPKCFSFLQLRMCFAFLKNCKIPIFIAAMVIETIVSVKQFLRNLPIILSKCSMFTFIMIKPITKFDFRFSKVGDYTTNFTFSQIENFFGIIYICMSL